MSKTKRGVEKREFDMLGMKFWLPLTTAEPDLDDEADASPDPAAAAAAADADAEKKEQVAGEDGEDGGEAAAAAEAEAEPEPEITVASRSFVYMFIRAAPKLNLWPQPKMTKKMSKKERRAIAFAPVKVCGKLFNGIPRGEAVDAAAIKLNRDLPKDPNSLAFSMRAAECTKRYLTRLVVT